MSEDRPLVETSDVIRIVDELAAAGQDGATWLESHDLASDVVEFVAGQLEGSFQRPSSMR